MNIDHERNDAVRALLAREHLLRPEIEAQLEQPWRTNGFVVRVVFFLLTGIALGAFAIFCHLLGLGYPGFTTCVVAIATAEYLIRNRRWFATGVENALWLGGTMAFISELPKSGTPEALLVIAVAFALPAARVRNPLFGAAAAICIAIYFEERFDLGVLASLILATLALLALLRTWRRPSNEWLFIAIALALPIAGITQADAQWRNVTIALYFAFALLALILGITRRHHAFFLASMIGFAIATTELFELLPLVNEAKLAIAGALLLAIAFAITRALRERTHGFVLTPAKLTSIDDELELAATMSLKPESRAPDVPKSGGGSFGGAGASGEF